MDKTALLMKLRAAQRTLDEVMGAVLAMEDVPPPAPPVKEQSQETEPCFTAKQLMKHLHISESTFYLWIEKGLLPPGEAWGPKSKRWKLSEIDAWRASCQTNNARVHERKVGRHRGYLSQVAQCV